MGAAQHKWNLDDATGMRAEGLDALPNALEADYWLRKAAAVEQGGDLEVGTDLMLVGYDVVFYIFKCIGGTNVALIFMK